MESPEIIGLCIFLAIVCFVKWYYDSSEKEFNTFLSRRLHQKTRAEAENKTERQLEIEEKLEEVGNPITYEKLYQYSLLAMVVPPVVFTVIGAPMFSLITIPLGYKLPELYVMRKKDEKIKLFSEGLADALSQLLAIIQAGQSQLQGFRVLSDMPYPMGMEFGRIYHDIKTGASVKQALDDFHERVPLKDIQLFNIGAIISQKATPAVSISTLKTIISTIQKRESQKKSIKTAVTGGQLTAVLLACLPAVMFVGIWTLMPDAMNAFLGATMGKIGLVVAVILDIIGYFAAKRVTSVDRMIDY